MDKEEPETQQKVEAKEEEEIKKDPETLSEGERMGLSKQQLRKLEKRLTAEAKKKKKAEEVEQEKKEAATKKTEKKVKAKVEGEDAVSSEYLKEF